MATEGTGIDLLGVNCEANARSAIATVNIGFVVSGTDVFTTGAGTITGTLSGSGSNPTLNRITSNGQIYNNDPSTNGVIVRAPCCMPDEWEMRLDATNKTLVNMATVSCTCASGTCSGYPKTGTHDFIYTVEILQTFPSSAKKYQIHVVANVDQGGACAFIGTATWSGVSSDINQADLIGVHTLTITTAATATLVTTVTIA